MQTETPVPPPESDSASAIDTETGKVKWQQKQGDLPAQGYLLASQTRLYVPAGRNNPVVLNLSLIHI